MTTREKIMGRIRAALQVPALRPGLHGEVPQIPTGSEVQKWLPPGGESFVDQLKHLRLRAAELTADFQMFDSVDEVKLALAKIANTEQWQRIATHRGELTETVVNELGLPVLTTTGGYDVSELEACGAGITECDALIAQTGSLIVTSRDAGGRALSVLPPHHVVLARRGQIVRDLSAGFALVQKKYAPKYPSMISVVTGPSRTGDIERILVLGAHGPKKLTILCY